MSFRHNNINKNKHKTNFLGGSLDDEKQIRD